MVISVNHIFECVNVSTSQNQTDIETLIQQQQQHTNPMKSDHTETRSLSHLIIDVDTSLARIYGGFYNDWLVGGEWTHLQNYMESLLKTCQALSLCLIFCFDGSLYRSGQSLWYDEQTQQRKKVNLIFKHLKQNKSGSPRRSLWLCPAGFQLCLRLILRQLNSSHFLIRQTYGYGHGEHQRQLKALAMQHRSTLLGIVSSDMEFLLPAQYADQLVILPCFSSKYFKVSSKGKLTLVEIRLEKLKEQYSLDDKQFSLLLTLSENPFLSESDLSPFYADLLRDQSSSRSSSSPKPISIKINGNHSPTPTDSFSNDYNGENTSSEINDDSIALSTSLTNPTQYKENRLSFNIVTEQYMTRLIDFIRRQTESDQLNLTSIANYVFKHLSDMEARQSKVQLFMKAYQHYQVPKEKQIVRLIDLHTSAHEIDKPLDNFIIENESKVNLELVRTVFNLHQQGLIMPWILQSLYKRELTFPVSIEPEICTTIPNICDFYRPIRQFLYGLLFNSKGSVREMVYNSEHGSYLNEVYCDRTLSKCKIEQLWLDKNLDNISQLRLKIFLQSLHYCDLPRFYTMSQDYFLLTCILRYIYMTLVHSFSTSIPTHTYELMAFISQAVLLNEFSRKCTNESLSNDSNDPLEPIQMNSFEIRPIQLAQLFMRGFETVLFANEVCASPIDPKYICPWKFFNGRLFHYKYIQAHQYQQNPDLMSILCDGNTRYVQIANQLLDIVLDRISPEPAHLTPAQSQTQVNGAIPPPPPHLARGQKQSVQSQSFVANSIRPSMRQWNKQTVDNHQQHRTPITNHRQQQRAPPMIKHNAQTKMISTTNANNAVTPFHVKSSHFKEKFQSKTPAAQNNSNKMLAQIHSSSMAGTWNESGLPDPYQLTMAPMVPLPPAHSNPNNGYLLDEHFHHLQLHPSPMMTSATVPINYPQHSMASFNHLHPSTPFVSYSVGTSSPYFHPSSTSMATPFHGHAAPLMPGVPPHAPLPPQRTANFSGNILSNHHSTPTIYPGPSPRLSPNSMQTHSIQQRMFDQQTPISIQRQFSRLPVNQYEYQRSDRNQGQIPLPMHPMIHSNLMSEQISRVAHYPC